MHHLASIRCDLVSPDFKRLFLGTYCMLARFGRVYFRLERVILTQEKSIPFPAVVCDFRNDLSSISFQSSSESEMALT